MSLHYDECLDDYINLLVTTIIFLLTGSFKNRLLTRKLREHQIWYESEQGRYLCIDGRSYGNTTFSWKFGDSELTFMDLKLPDGNTCNLKGGGCSQLCLRTLVPQLLPADVTGPRPVLLKYSACTSDNAVQGTEFFEYITILVFGIISTANEGNYSFSIGGHIGTFFFPKLESKAHITVAKARIVSKVELIVGSLSNPHEVLLKQKHLYFIQCIANHGLNTTPQWLRDNKPIKKLFINGSVNDVCHNATLNVFYTVETNTSTTSFYNHSYSLVTEYSSNARLYLCHITEAIEDYYSCSITTDQNTTVTKGVTVMLEPSSSFPTGEDNSNTETLLIIWFAVLNGILVVAISITLVVWCWMRCAVKKQKSDHSVDDVGLPAYMHNYLEVETSFIQDGGDDPLEFPFSQLEFLHLLGLCGKHLSLG